MKAKEMAQGIINGTFKNIDSAKAFTELSGIYKFTNEDIASYFHHLQNKKEILSVISSGNHILNAILGGSRNIDCFDISIFPEYYLYLQIAAIMSLSKEEYLEYLLSNDRGLVFSEEYYNKIRNNLKGKYKEFWDYLYNYTEEGYEIYNSLLFRTDPITNKVIDVNPYLQDSNYEKLKHILETDSIRINPMVTNIINTRFEKEYDLILLSNILAYNFTVYQMDEYFFYLENNFRLKENGELIDLSLGNHGTSEKKKRLNSNSYIENVGSSKILVYRK